MAQEGEQIIKEWGYELIVTNMPEYCMKMLFVKPGKQCSLHRHMVKSESFLLEQGVGLIEIGFERYRMERGSIAHIPVGTWHRFGNLGPSELILREISTHHDDADVEREKSSGDIPLLPKVDFYVT